MRDCENLGLALFLRVLRAPAGPACICINMCLMYMCIYETYAYA